MMLGISVLRRLGISAVLRVSDCNFETRDFAGDIAVDDEGYIYVADVFNGRIQNLLRI